MSARAMWKGIVRLGPLRVPVKLYAAVQDRGIHFHLLHAREHVRLRQRLADPDTDATVEQGEVQRAFEVEKQRFVVLTREELDELEPPPSRDIRIERCLPPEAIPHPWYLRPYWLGPDGDEAAYFALVTALQQTGLSGLARWVMRKKRYVGALSVHGAHLMLITLRHAGEVIPIAELEPPAGRALDAREHEMAEQLIEALAGGFAPEDYRDEHRERVAELIDKKKRGGGIELVGWEPEAPTEDLADALRASLEAVG
jgi:DNA end-binding protein Ku